MKPTPVQDRIREFLRAHPDGVPTNKIQAAMGMRCTPITSLRSMSDVYITAWTEATPIARKRAAVWALAESADACPPDAPHPMTGRRRYHQYAQDVDTAFRAKIRQLIAGAEEGMTITEIAVGLGTPARIDYLRSTLHKMAGVYIDRWFWPARGGRCVAVWMAGDFQDCPRPEKKSHR